MNFQPIAFVTNASMTYDIPKQDIPCKNQIVYKPTTYHVLNNLHNDVLDISSTT